MKNRNNNKKESKKQNVMRATKSNKKNEGEIRKWSEKQKERSEK